VEILEIRHSRNPANARVHNSQRSVGIVILRSPRCSTIDCRLQISDDDNNDGSARVRAIFGFDLTLSLSLSRDPSQLARINGAEERRTHGKREKLPACRFNSAYNPRGERARPSTAISCESRQGLSLSLSLSSCSDTRARACLLIPPRYARGKPFTWNARVHVPYVYACVYARYSYRLRQKPD